MIDLHTHTIYSDGELLPLELLELCDKKGVSIVSFTDHDTLSAYKDLNFLNPYPNITVIPGIELDGYYPEGQQHILGYNMDVKDENLNNIVRQIQEDNIRRIESLITVLKKEYGFVFKETDIDEIFSSVGTIGRPLVAKLILKYGYSNSIKDIFTRYLNPVKSKVVKKKLELTAKECINYLKKAGGIVSIAHPITLKKDDDELKKYLKNLKSYGLDAIEVYHSTHTDEFRQKLYNIATDLELLISGGSDYHGPVIKPDIMIGTGRSNNLNIQELSIISKITR